MVTQNALQCKKQDDLQGWVIALAVVVVIETVVILIGAIDLLMWYKFGHSMFFASTGKRVPIQEKTSDTNSYASVALNDR